MFIQIIGSLQLGLLYAAMAMGVFVTFRILDIADLTVDGSFVTGMATAAVVTIAANNPVLGILAGTAAGGLAGLRWQRFWRCFLKPARAWQSAPPETMRKWCARLQLMQMFQNVWEL